MKSENIPSSIGSPQLLDQVRERLRVKHYSIRTEMQYVHCIKRFILYHDKRHPGEMGEKEVEAFLTNLLQSGYDIRRGQELLGQSNVSTTMIYTHVLNKGGRGVASPQDQL